MLQYSIKVASLLDKEKILPLMLKFKEESFYSIMETDKQAILDTIEDTLLRDKKKTIVLLASDDNDPDNVIGIIVGSSSKLMFNNDYQALETIWYVLPEYRKLTVGLELFEAFIYWATNIVNARVIHTTSPKGSKLSKIYKKQGYNLLEEVFVKVI